MEIRQQLQQKQKIIASQSMIQHLGLLQMDQLELTEHINEQLNDNPVLDRSEDSELSERIASLKQRFLWMRSFSVFYPMTGRNSSAESIPDDASAASYLESLEFAAKDQLRQADVSENCRRLALILSGMLDERGYLDKGDFEDIRSKEGSDADLALSVLRSLEPAGIGAFGLKDCLLLQLERSGCDDGTVLAIVKDHLEDLAAGRIRQIAKRAGCSAQEVAEAKELISALDPAPASRFSAPPKNHYIIPDAYVIVEDGRPEAVFSETCQPEVCINPYYLELFSSTDDPQTKEYLKEKIRQAKELLAGLKKRRESFRSCLDIIIRVQKDFFVSGEALRPLMQRELASELGLNPSTVSRMVRGKYLQCARGTFPLSYFIRKRVNSVDIAPASVQEEIRLIIAGEDKSHPLSDERICRTLGDRGIPIARRTVMKYRSELGIPKASERKRL
jgi:RNA polymerase sigma-54 factor